MTTALVVSMRCVRRFVRCTGGAALAAGLVCALAPAAATGADDLSDPYSFDVVLSPVCLDGIFPITIQKTAGGTVNGELHVHTNVKGHLSGFVDVNGIALGLGGTVSRGTGTVHVSFTASEGPDKIKFVGDVADGATTLTGTTTGKGFLAQGGNTFSLNLSTAGPETATIEFGMVRNAKGKISGKGHVLACTNDTKLTASGKTSKTGVMTFALKQGTAFKFTATGPAPASGGDVVVDWTASGFGGKASGTALLFIPVTPPEALSYPQIAPDFEIETAIPTIIPTSGTAPRGQFKVVPSLPTGLVLDATNGRITGTPTEIRGGMIYTITASNFLGSVSATLGFATRIPRARSFAPFPGTPDDPARRHFLARAEFGIRQLGGGQTNLTRLNSIGLDAYIDQMLVFSKTGPAEAIAAPELGGNYPSSQSLSRWWSSLLMNTDNPFQERLAFFWADRFAVSSDNLEAAEAHLMTDYVNLYRYEGNGNLRTLLLKMARSGAMLKYLDGVVNAAGATNENFAREFWELFTLGVDNGYTQADIVQASHAWTGWKMVTNVGTGLANPVFDPARHDTTVKNVLGFQVGGQSATDDFQQMVDVTVDHGQVAEFITTKLFEQFGFENPHPDLVTAMAANLRLNNYELAPFLKTLFKSEAFFSSTARNALVKNPIDYAVGFVHLTGLKITPDAFQKLITDLGQSPTEPPSVNGWPNGQLWFSAQNMADRANFVDACVSDTQRQMSVGINVASILPPVSQRSASQVVDGLASLFSLTLLAEERQTCIDFLNAAGLFDGTNQTQIDTRVRDLIFILAQHPQFQVR